ncbi:hypothetical protein [Streptomyces sp. NPDC046821]|uniref:hypothetical protein n=1 Tax=Streptomyces sp. NPDC046821 TaxID=3154702 RepID=UPI0033DB93B3
MEWGQRHVGGEPSSEGCLVAAIRVPVRIVVLVLVVPVRLAWDALAAAGRFVWRRCLVPLARGVGRLLHGLLVVPVVWLWRYALAPVLRILVAVPAQWLYTYVLTPLGRAIAVLGKGVGAVLAVVGRALGVALVWLTKALLVWPWAVLWRYVLSPVLVPVGRALLILVREIGDALGHAWRVAGYVSRAVGRFLGRILRWIFVDPARWVYRSVCTPLGHFVRDTLWRPTRQILAAARASVRQARADVRRALFGAPRAEPEPLVRDRREPGSVPTRTLGSSTTALTKTAFIKD